MTLTFYDASTPPRAGQEPRTDGVAFYIGGNTPHVWTVPEIGRQGARYRLPIWVRSNPFGTSPATDVRGAVQRLAEIGAPRGSLVALDLETATDPGFVRVFEAGMMDAGAHPVITYGSRSVVHGNEAARYWDADWTGQPHISPGSAMTQYVNRPAYDLSLAEPNLPFWDTRPQLPAPAGLSITGHAGFANLGWGTVPGATEYEFRIIGAGGAGTGTSAAGRVVKTTHVQDVQLAPGHYLGRVRAGNGSQWSPWSAERGFLVMKP